MKGWGDGKIGERVTACLSLRVFVWIYVFMCVYLFVFILDFCQMPKQIPAHCMLFMQNIWHMVLVFQFGYI